MLSGLRSRTTWGCGSADWSDCGKAALTTASAAACTRQCNEHDLIAPEGGRGACVPPQKSKGVRHDRVEHRLDVCLRSAYDAEDFASRRLRVERRRQFAVARLQLRKQADILDGDDRL